MYTKLLLLLGFSGAMPLAAQTVMLPSVNVVEDRTGKTLTAKKDAAANRMFDKMMAINNAGSNGYDIVTFDSRTRAVRGSAFLMQQWVRGNVLLGTAKAPVEGIFKFDIYNQQLRAFREEGDSIILAPDQVQAFTLRPTGPNTQIIERHFERLPAGLVSAQPQAYAEAISSGHEVRLVKFLYRKVLKGHADSSYGNNVPVDVFESATQYYIRWSDGTYAPVKPNKASVLAAIVARQPALANAALENKQKARTDAELGALVESINGAMGK